MKFSFITIDIDLLDIRVRQKRQVSRESMGQLVVELSVA